VKQLLIASFVVLILTACEPVPVPSELAPTPSQTQVESNNFEWTWLNNTNEQPYTSDEDLLRKNYIVVFDGSGSMGGERLTIAKRAATAFTGKLDPQDALGLVVFDGAGTSVRVSLAYNNSNEFQSQINDIDAGGGTPLADAMVIGYRELQKQGSKQRGYGEYHLIVITDGEASGGQDPGQLVRQIVNSTPINIHTIGFQFSGSHSLNQSGITTYYQADNYDELMNSFSSILAESTTFDVTDFQ
jgi:secreted protein with Ig-like and vWFA domain